MRVLTKRWKFLVILLGLIAVPVYVFWVFWPRDSSAEYALLIDAGSSGSRIHLYKWQLEDDAPIPLIDEVTLEGDCDKAEPGLLEPLGDADACR